MRVSIIQGSPSGTEVYKEIYNPNPTTNANGLVSVEIGSGVPLTGTFSGINWSNGPYYIKTETDPAGGTNYSITGTSELLSVPYALHAKSAETVTETDPVYSSKFDVTGSTNGDLLRYNGTQYVKFTPNYLTSYTETDPVYKSEIDVTGSSNNKILKHNGTKYVASSTGNLSTTTSGVTITGGSNALIGTGTAIDIATASGTATGLLSSSDWNSFNNRWSITGNTVTVDGTHFIGTTDNVPLNFKVNNVKLGRIGLTGDASTFLGYEAGNSDDHSNNWCVGIGYQALYSNTNGDDNTATGYKALYSNTTGYSNTANGVNALYNNTTGNYNTANGSYALYFNTTGAFNTANGSYALYNNTTGNVNTALGRSAGYGASGVNFNQCTFVGYNSYPTVNRTNVTMLGANITNGQCTADNQVLLGSTSVTQIRAQVGSITTYSDARYKFNIQEDVKGLDFIMKLKPVTYQQNPEILHQIWGTPDSIIKNIDHSQIKQQRFIGFLAQDVEKAANESGFDFPGLDKPRNANEVYSLRYGDFIMPLVISIQELDKKNEELVKENAELKRKLEQLNQEVEVIKTYLDTQSHK